MTTARSIAVFFVCAFAAVPLRAVAEGVDDDTPADRVQTAAESYFHERFPDYADRLEVRVVRIRGELPDTGAVRLRFAGADGVPRGHAQARISMGSDGQADEVGWAILYVAHFDSVAVALRDLPRGGTVASGDITAAWIDVTSFRGQPLTVSDLSVYAAPVAARPLSAGDVLRDGDLRPPFAADTGAPVVMTYRRGPVRLKLTCRARESGVLDEIIRLYSDATKTTYKARLTGEGAAEWVATL